MSSTRRTQRFAGRIVALVAMLVRRPSPAPPSVGAVSGAAKPAGGCRGRPPAPYPPRSTCAPTARSRRCARRTTSAPAGSSPPWRRSSPACSPGALACDFSENNLANHMASTARSSREAAPTRARGGLLRALGRARARARRTRIRARAGSPEGPARRAPRAGRPLPAGAHVDPLDNDAVKWAVTTYGGVDTAPMAFDGSALQRHRAPSRYYSTQGGSGAQPPRDCVGWDDGFPASRLQGDATRRRRLPHQEQLGHRLGRRRLLLALVLRRQLTGRSMAVFSGAEGAGNYDAIYQYDALG